MYNCNYYCSNEVYSIGIYQGYFFKDEINYSYLFSSNYLYIDFIFLEMKLYVYFIDLTALIKIGKIRWFNAKLDNYKYGRNENKLSKT